MVKRIASLLLAAVCLSSCGSGVKIEHHMKEYDTEYSSVHAEVPEISGLADGEFEDSLNDSFEKDTDSALIAFDTAAENSADNIRMGNKCIFETNWENKYNQNDFLSLVEERYIYMGGAHGETAWLPRNIDLAASKQIQLADLFAEAGYENTLNRMITEAVQEDGEQYGDLWEKPVIKDSHQTDFYIRNGKLVIFYQPYDLSYYARGFVEFPLSLSELSGYLKEEYRRLI